MSRTTKLLFLIGTLMIVPACQQKMADQPYYRPYEETSFFPNKQSARPIVEGTVHRAQRLEDDPLVSGLTPAGRKRSLDRERLRTEEGEAAADKKWALAPANYVDKFPFAMTASDIRRGAERYGVYCIECHGVMGNGGGKIVERGFLRPPSYHTVKLEPTEPEETLEELRGHPRGYSRGFARWGQKIELDKVPVGYIYEVITNGYGVMPQLATSIPPADRWRIAAYVRTLQFSQNSKLADLPPEVRAEAEKALNK